jgi:hypothetical protein
MWRSWPGGLISPIPAPSTTLLPWVDVLREAIVGELRVGGRSVVTGLISFEGLPGAGKFTPAALLAACFTQQGLPVVSLPASQRSDCGYPPERSGASEPKADPFGVPVDPDYAGVVQVQQRGQHRIGVGSLRPGR